ncbi:unnamed protein product [Calypogeia fissa]
MALLQLPVLREAGGAVFEASRINRRKSSNDSMRLLPSASRIDACSLGGRYKQSSCSQFWRGSQGNESISVRQRFSGYGIIARMVIRQLVGEIPREIMEVTSVASRSALMVTENDDAEDKDSENSDGLGPDFNRESRDFDNEGRYGSRQTSVLGRILERLSRVPAEERIWSTQDKPSPNPAVSFGEKFRPDTRFPWEREDARGEAPAAEKLIQLKPPSLAELTLPQDELMRLKSLLGLTKHCISVGSSGVTDGVGESIHNQWRTSEVARVKCKGPPAHNMKRTHEILEERTGGLIVWRVGGACLIYRGKDYVPPPLNGPLDFLEQSTPTSVIASLDEGQAMSSALQEEDDEKGHLLPPSREVSETSVQRSIGGTSTERYEAFANWERVQDSDEQLQIADEVPKSKLRNTRRKIERKVAICMAKKHIAELELQKVEKRLLPVGPALDRENITDEERDMFIKLGLEMHECLLLGKRGVFEGTVDHMHEQWKRRPVVKVIYKVSYRVDLEQTARMLELESRGIVVAMIPTDKGQAIIVYRGKNYQCTPKPRPLSLLTKGQALKRSIEVQRQQALTKHLLVLEKEIEDMKAVLGQMGPLRKEVILNYLRTFRIPPEVILSISGILV